MMPTATPEPLPMMPDPDNLPIDVTKLPPTRPITLPLPRR